MTSLIGLLIGYMSSYSIACLLWYAAYIRNESWISLTFLIATVMTLISAFFLLLVFAKLNFYIRERKLTGTVGMRDSMVLLDKYMRGEKPDKDTFALLCPEEASNAN